MAVNITHIQTPGAAGTAASIVTGAPSGKMRVAGLVTATMHVGNLLALEQLGAYGNRANHGVFQIATIVDGTHVDVINGSAIVPDTGPLWWVYVDGTNNNWEVTPANDTEDADNAQFTFWMAAVIETAIPHQAVILMRGDSGPFHWRKQIAVADLNGSISASRASTFEVILGTNLGGPMDLLTGASYSPTDPTNQYAFPSALIPRGLVLYNLLGGVGCSLTINGMFMHTTPSTNARTGTQWSSLLSATGNVPWDNANCSGAIAGVGMIQACRTFLVTGITAPDGGGHQTVTIFSPFFQASDAGTQNLIIYDTPNAGNNGIFPITAVADGTHCTIHNAGGVIDAGANYRGAIILNPSPAGLVNLTLNNCNINGSLGSSVVFYDGDRISNLQIGVDFGNNMSSAFEGTVTPPVNSVSSGYDTQMGVVSGRYFWFADSHILVPGNLIMNNVSFAYVGQAWEKMKNWVTNHGMAYTMPANAPTNPVIQHNGGTLLDCGLYPGVFTIGDNGVPDISFIDIEGIMTLSNISDIKDATGTSNNPSNGLGFLLSFDGNGIPDPLSSTQYGNGSPPQIGTAGSVGGIPPYVVLVENVTVNFGPATGAQPASGFVSFLGHARGAGEPNSFFTDFVVKNSQFIGQALTPFSVEGLDGMTIENNTIQGQTSVDQIQIGGCTNVEVKNNNFTVAPATGHYNVSLDNQTKNCSVINTGGATQPLVHDLGVGNRERGCIVTTT